MEHIYSQTCSVCGGLHPLADGEGTADIDPLYLNLVEAVYKGEISKGEIDIPTTVNSAQRLMQAVFTGYLETEPQKGETPAAFVKRSWSTIKYDTPDYDKLQHIENNVYQFAGAKNYQEVRAFTDALKDGDRVLSKSEHLKACKKILNTYEGTYHDTEYNLAMAGAQAGSRWVSIEKAGKLNPKGLAGVLLEYRTMGDGRVREAHALLNRVRRYANDAFWKIYGTPNGYGCRCYELVVHSGEETPEKDILYPEVPKMFRTNIGQTGLVFPEDHPYFIGCPKGILKQVAQLAPQKDVFETIFKHGKGSVTRHIGVDTKAGDYKIIEKVAKEKAKLGHTVEILPEIQMNDLERRKSVLPGVKGVKNPDLRIDGLYVDVKSPESAKKVVTRIMQGADQADAVIVDWHSHYNFGKMKKTIFKEKPDLKYFEVRVNGKYTRYEP